MHVQLVPAPNRVERPGYVWLAFALEIVIALMALPVGWQFIAQPDGSSLGMPAGWIEATVFGTYLVPGLYLFAVNGLVMLGLAGLTLVRHWTAPWLTGVLGVGLIAWIVVQVLVMPETMFLQWVIGAAGIEIALTGLFWLRRTGQLRLR